MKVASLAGLLLLSSVSAFAQGTVNFANADAGLNWPVFSLDGTTLLAGPDWKADLLVGHDSGSLTPVATATFSTGAVAGYFFGGVVILPGFAPGTNPFFQVRFWNNEGGAVSSYDFASARFSSEVFLLLGGLGGSGNPPASLIGVAVPEPSVLILSIGGVGILLFLRRHKICRISD